MAALKILLVDDQGLFLEGLKHLLGAHGFDVVGTAGDGLEALAQARALRPDLILMDVYMPRCDGLEATRLIKTEMPDAKIVMLSVSDADDTLFEAVRSGAFGYLLKQSDASEFLDLLSRAGRGEPPFSPGFTSRIMQEFARQAPPTRGPLGVPENGAGKLSPRQLGVLTLVAQGLTYREVAATLCLSEHAIKYHVKQILERLHIENRAQLIACAHQMGLLQVRQEPPGHSEHYLKV